MEHTPSSEYLQGRQDERNAIREMIVNILKTNADIRNLPGHLVLQVLAASISYVNGEDDDANVSTTSVD